MKRALEEVARAFERAADDVKGRTAVRDVVRRVMPTILNLRGRGVPWAQVTACLGLTWHTGAPVSGQQLCRIISDIERLDGAPRRPRGRPRQPQVWGGREVWEFPLVDQDPSVGTRAVEPIKESTMLRRPPERLERSSRPPTRLNLPPDDGDLSIADLVVEPGSRQEPDGGELKRLSARGPVRRQD